MKNYQDNKLAIRNFNSDILSNFDNKNLTDLLSKRNNLISFFDYLKINKINYEILDFKPNSYLLLKLLTLNPKYLTIVLSETDIQNYLVNFKDLKNLKKNFLLNDDIKRNSYIVFIDKSINSTKELRKKALYVHFKKISLMEEFKRIIDINTKILVKNELRSGLPFGKYYKRNKMNELTGKEWIKFTKSWYIHNPPPRSKTDLLHPAKFPESLVEKYIRFFTKKRDIVIDPFLGTGATGIAAINTMRSCIGIEINKKYINIAKMRLAQETLDKWVDIDKKLLYYEVINGDSRNLKQLWEKKKFPEVDFCITSPPYWNQLKRNSLRQMKRKNEGLDTIYSNSINDIGNIDDYHSFIETQKNIFDDVYKILKNKGYLVIITNNLFYKGRVIPLAFDTALSLSNKWVLKDEQIWCQDDKQLIPLGVNNAYVGNRHHVYCLIFRKEEV